MDSQLLGRAKQMLRTGGLPWPQRFVSYGGPSRGATCVLCDTPIAPGDLEIEVEWRGDRGPERLTLHPRCQSAWHVALAELKREESTANAERTSA